MYKLEILEARVKEDSNTVTIHVMEQEVDEMGPSSTSQSIPGAAKVA